MNGACRILLYGFAISFVGALVPGAMTLTATLIGANNGILQGVSFGLGAAVAEILVIVLLLYMLRWGYKWSKWNYFLNILTTLFFASGAIGCFVVGYYCIKFESVTFIFCDQPFSGGFFIGILNPLNIPFWTGWSSVLMEKNLLRPSLANYGGYLVGIFAGSMIVFLLYILGGKIVLNEFVLYRQLIMLMTGTILVIVTFGRIRKLFMPGKVVTIVQ